MSTDALREFLRKWHLEAKQDLAEASANDVDEKESAYLAGRISAYEEVLAALAAPASEAEKLPARWRRQARVDCDPATGSERIHARGLAKDACADELEEALKKDKTNEQ